MTKLECYHVNQNHQKSNKCAEATEMEKGFRSQLGLHGTLGLGPALGMYPQLSGDQYL
jgi:hypothetical protein